MMRVMPDKKQSLGEYIKEKLEGRSIRALATYAGISVGTASNLINDRVDNPDPQTLLKVAEYLNVPIEYLFQLAGYLPDRKTTPAAVLEVAELMQQLPPHKQEEILAIVKTMHQH
jgi:transcriptional regulator with XRE-family HTH domain